MKKLFRIAGLFVLFLLVLTAAAIAYIKIGLPDVGDAPSLQVDLTDKRIERGRYLAHAVCVCVDCHSTRDWSKFSGPITPGTLGKGGERFDQAMGFPGVYYSKNITPFGIKRYSDGELYRLITSGVTKEGRAIFPVMPYPCYGRMDDEDIYSIIAYVRTLKAVDNTVLESDPDFPMNILLGTLPEKNSPTKLPEKNDEISYGAYLINAAACKECHTPAERGQIIPELAYSGGREFKFPDGSILRSSNITPDGKTGIGKWTRENFIQRFKVMGDSSYILPDVKPGEFNTLMPWTMYANMKEDDLGAIYAYLHSLKPIGNQVARFTRAPREASKDL
jgi:hypothetical protein